MTSLQMMTVKKRENILECHTASTRMSMARLVLFESWFEEESPRRTDSKYDEASS